MAERVEVKASLPPAALVALPVAVAAQHVCRKLAKENKNGASESGGCVEFLLYSLRVQQGLTLLRCFFPKRKLAKRQYSLLPAFALFVVCTVTHKFLIVVDKWQTNVFSHGDSINEFLNSTLHDSEFLSCKLPCVLRPLPQRVAGCSCKGEEKKYKIT